MKNGAGRVLLEGSIILVGVTLLFISMAALIGAPLLIPILLSFTFWVALLILCIIILVFDKED